MAMRERKESERRRSNPNGVGHGSRGLGPKEPGLRGWKGKKSGPGLDFRDLNPVGSRVMNDSLEGHDRYGGMSCWDTSG